MAEATIAAPVTPAPTPSMAAVEAGDFTAFQSAERARSQPPVESPAAQPASAPGTSAEPEQTVSTETLSAAPVSDTGLPAKGQELKARLPELDADIESLKQKIALRRQLREELEGMPPAHVQPASAPAAASAPQIPVDPNDPEPTFDTFKAAHPDHPDPYAGFLREQGKWDRRQEAKAEAVTRGQQAQAQARHEAVSAYGTRVAAFEAEHADFELVTAPFIQAHARHPYGPAITQALLADDAGPAVLYHLAGHPEAAATVFRAPNPARALVALGMVAASLSALTSPPPKPALVTPNPTLLGRKPAAPVDEALAAVARGDFPAFQAVEAAKRRAAREASHR